jgi:2-polyprenyl-3-methyl-5-hydroxy-6-metoxy-1,4-benzoquinol methylase
VLEHIDDPEPVVQKLMALLAPGGKMIVSGPMENLLYKTGRWLAGFSGHYHVRNIYQIEQILAGQGMQKRKNR